jgi:hypothetical protein
MQLELTDVKLTQKQRVLRALRAAGPQGVTNAQLNSICFRYGARIFELRREGYDIRQKQIKRGLFRVWLEPQAETSDD